MTENDDGSYLLNLVNELDAELKRIGRINTEENRPRTIPELTIYMWLEKARTALRAEVTERARLLTQARTIKVQIEQIFTDCASWNDNARKPNEAPIDPDPDGSLACALAYVNGILNGDVYIAPERKS